MEEIGEIESLNQSKDLPTYLNGEIMDDNRRTILKR